MILHFVDNPPTVPRQDERRNFLRLHIGAKNARLARELKAESDAAGGCIIKRRIFTRPSLDRTFFARSQASPKGIVWIRYSL